MVNWELRDKTEIPWQMRTGSCRRKKSANRIKYFRTEGNE